MQSYGTLWCEKLLFVSCISKQFVPWTVWGNLYSKLYRHDSNIKVGIDTHNLLVKARNYVIYSKWVHLKVWYMWGMFFFSYLYMIIYNFILNRPIPSTSFMKTDMFIFTFISNKHMLPQMMHCKELSLHVHGRTPNNKPKVEAFYTATISNAFVWWVSLINTNINVYFNVHRFPSWWHKNIPKCWEYEHFSFYNLCSEVCIVNHFFRI